MKDIYINMEDAYIDKDDAIATMIYNLFINYFSKIEENDIRISVMKDIAYKFAENVHMLVDFETMCRA